METQQVGPACQEYFDGRGVATICEQFASECECVCGGSSLPSNQVPYCRSFLNILILNGAHKIQNTFILILICLNEINLIIARLHYDFRRRSEMHNR